MPLFGKSKEKSNQPASEVSKVGNGPSEYLKENPEAIKDENTARIFADLEKEIRRLGEVAVVNSSKSYRDGDSYSQKVNESMISLKKFAEKFKHAMTTYQEVQAQINGLNE